MSQAAAEVQSKIDYLVPTSRINRRFWAPGAELNTGIYAPYPVTVHNARLADEPIALDTFGFCLGRHRTAVDDFGDAAKVAQLYPGEVASYVSARTGADLVVPLGGMMRSA